MSRRPGESFDEFFTRQANLRWNKTASIFPSSPEGPHFTISDIDEPANSKSSKSKKEKKRKKRRLRSRSRSNSLPSDADFTHHKKYLDDDDQEIGPLPEIVTTVEIDDRDYGAMLKGEGAAIAAFVQAGKRIPRRGEVGIDPEMFEKEGYVMSGNRNKHMEDVRLRKETLVLNAEEKRAMFLLAQQNKQRKEAEIMSTFKEIVSDRMKKIVKE